MKQIWLCLVLVLALSCQEKVKIEPLVGEWKGLMKLSEEHQLPFNFLLSKNLDGFFQMEMRNADEVIVVDEITIKNDSIVIKMPVFEGYIAGTYSDSTITGEFIKESLDRYVPFEASYGDLPRFKVIDKAQFDVSGIWETTFDFDTDSPYPAKGIFYQYGNSLTGTFRTKTGDYRYLEGVVDGNMMKLSTFDGAHVFLFKAQLTDSTMNGQFYSGNHSVENFIAKRNPSFELPDANTLTYLKEGYDRFDFSFPDSSGNKLSLKDESFKDKVVVVQIYGHVVPKLLGRDNVLCRLSC